METAENAQKSRGATVESIRLGRVESAKGCEGKIKIGFEEVVGPAPALGSNSYDRKGVVVDLDALTDDCVIARKALPAITHVNGSARVQTVSQKDNREFHALLEAVGKTTGRQMVLNTSFNVKGQPIVNTPREAIYTFLGTGIEYLFMEDTLVRRAGQK